ncbi:MAG: amino acid permease, partial [Isosphaeraceae bacterium]
MANPWVRKSIAGLKAEAAESHEHSLKRTLTATNLVMLGIGAVIGAGFFVLTGHAAAENAGPAISLSFVLGGIVCAFAGLCYAEMASTVPIAGSAYTYAYATMGEFIAWLIGWDLILEYMVGATTVAIGWSGYVTSFLHDLRLHIPAQFTMSPGTKLIEIPNEVANKLHLRHGWSALDSVQDLLTKNQIDFSTFPQVTAVLNIPAMLIVALVTALLVVGIQESARVNNVIVAIKVTIVVLFILIGLPLVTTSNWGGKFIPASTQWFEYGWSGIFRGAGLVFFAYIGFDAVSTAAQEAKNPQRDMPIGILGSLVICTILYIAVSLVLTGLVSYHSLDVADPVAVGIDATGVRLGSLMVKIGVVFGMGSVMLVMLLGQSRVFFSMSRDGLLWKWASKIHPRFRTPYISNIVVGSVVAMMAALLPIDRLSELVNMGTLLAFAIVCAGVWILRRRSPDLHRPFKTPLVPLVPILG